MPAGPPPPSLERLLQGGNVSLEDLLARMDQQSRNAADYRNSPGNNTLSAYLRDFAASMATGLNPAATETARAGMGRLLQMILNDGQLNPEFINDELRRDARDTESEVRGAQDTAARSGLRLSGQPAIEAAIRDAGSRRRAGIVADENERAIQRMQTNLGLVSQLAIGPGLTAADIETRRFLGTRDLGANPLLQAIGTGLGLFASAGGFQGGGNQNVSGTSGR